MSKCVAITHASVFSPIGCTISDFQKNMLSGMSGIKDITDLVGENFPVKYAGIIEHELIANRKTFSIDDENKIIIDYLLNELFKDLYKKKDIDLIIVAGNNSFPKFNEIESFYQGRLNEKNIIHETSIDYIVDWLDKFSINKVAEEDKITCVNGCITGLSAVAYAYSRIKSKKNKRALIVSVENLIRVDDLLRYNSIGVLVKEKCSPAQASRPFSMDRAGFVKGEGGGALLIEEIEAVELKDSNLSSVIYSCAFSSDAWRLTESLEDCSGVLKCYEKLFKHTNVRVEEIGYINAHGTGTLKNDFLESKAIQLFFGERSQQIPVSTLKSQVGHLNYACGVVEIIASAIMLKEQEIAPILNNKPDEQIKLNLVKEVSIKSEFKYLLKNSFGFGGSNASIIMGK